VPLPRITDVLGANLGQNARWRFCCVPQFTAVPPNIAGPPTATTLCPSVLHNVGWCLCKCVCVIQARCQLLSLHSVSDRWSVGAIRVTGENESTEIRCTRRKNCPSVTKLTTNPTRNERNYCNGTRVDTAGWHVSLHSSHSCQADHRKIRARQVRRGECGQRGCWWGGLKER